MENAGRSEYLEKQVDKIEKPLFETLLKPIKFAQGGDMQNNYYSKYDSNLKNIFRDYRKK